MSEVQVEKSSGDSPGAEASSSPPTTNAEDVKPSATETAKPTVSSPKPKTAKVDILLKPAGDAPIMKQKKWAVERTKRIAEVSSFIKKYIKSDPSESLFLYVNQSFAPAPDVDVGTVFDCFGSDGKLVLHYCKSQAWG